MNKIEMLEQKVLDNSKVILQRVNENGLEYSKIILPHLPDEELLRRYSRIKPIVYYQKLYYYLKRYNVDKMRNCSYIWDLERDIRDEVDMTDAKTILEFPCYHTYGYYGFFKPSIAEVLQQFPDDVLEEANAFYMSRMPEDSNDLELQSEIVNAGCHRSIVKALVLKK